MLVLYSFAEIIRFLEQRDFSKFRFCDEYLRINSDSDPSGIVLEVNEDGAVPEEIRLLAIDALKQIDLCVKHAEKWLDRLEDARNEATIPNVICFEHIVTRYEVKNAYILGFTITFMLRDSLLNREFVLKYAAHSFERGAFAVEEYIS